MAILNGIEDDCIQDTVISIENMTYYQSVGAYLRGARKPHYPVPSVFGALVKVLPCLNGAVYFYTNSVWTLTEDK